MAGPRRPLSRAPRRAVPAALLALALLAALAGCRREEAGVTLRFWAMGREGEVVQELVRDFERENPGVRVVVQQIPWGAAHEKLLTAHVGRSTPDLAQLGNTWIAEFAALRALAPLDSALAGSRSVADTAFFPGIWETNVVDGATWGIPWYVDTRVLFYRRDLLRAAGWDSVPGSWAEWKRAMQAMKRRAPARPVLFLPTNEYTPWIVFGLQAGSPLLKDGEGRGAFSDSAYRHAAAFYLGLFRDSLAPTVAGQTIQNRYQEFERGTISMYISGPWDVGEFKRRIAPSVEWATAPLPGPTGPESGLSTAGGSSLVVFRASRHPREAWRLIEFLSRPEQQARFWRLTGDLPARVEAWRDTALANDPNIRTFGRQLARVRSEPRIPEWQQISIHLQDVVESMVLGHAAPDSALAGMDRDVDRILEKRRWLLSRGLGSVR